MLLTVPDPKNLKTSKLSERQTKLRLIAYGMSILVFLFVLYQLSTVIFLRDPIESLSKDFSGSHFYNPYQKQNWKDASEKVALHIHSDRIWYTPERHSKQDIESVYRNNGFSVLSFTDYDQIQEDASDETELSGFEWGRNLRKRHAIVIGGKKTTSDLFPIYARRDNVSWTFGEMQETGGYVIIAHPKLNDSFTREDLVQIQNYNAVEVYSPFGDDSKILNTLLSKGREVHCMASDDLHYLPESITKSLGQPWWKDLLQTILLQRGREGESMRRYIATASGETNPKSVRKDLGAGSFYCVKKYFREAEDPNLPNMKIDTNGFVKLDSKERYLEIRWIGKDGAMKKIDPDTNVSFYQFSNEDPYIRVEIIALTGSILSNAIFRTENPKN